eukprot:6172766-Pleurochrysis_carterae.AAC.6
MRTNRSSSTRTTKRRHPPHLLGRTAPRCIQLPASLCKVILIKGDAARLGARYVCHVNEPTRRKVCNASNKCGSKLGSSAVLQAHDQTENNWCVNLNELKLHAVGNSKFAGNGGEIFASGCP